MLAEPQAGARLGKYVLRRSLGEGGGGQVFLAWKDNPSGHPIACVIKLPLHQVAKQPDGRERFMQEARIAARLGTNTHIVNVRDVEVVDGLPFIVFEYIDGTDLGALLHNLRKKGASLSLASIYVVLTHLATALDWAHATCSIDGKPVKIVHRDIKPANVLISRDGIAKLTDFGISSTMDDGTSGSYLRGTARYMSPEHLRGELRPEMDIYSFGVLAWELVENRDYPTGSDVHAHYAAILSGDIPPMRNSNTPEQLVSLIQSCLDPAPRRRHTADELLHMLPHCPGYSGDLKHFKEDIVSVIGNTASTGFTKHEFKLTPELVATRLAHQQEEQDDPPTPEQEEPQPVAPQLDFDNFASSIADVDAPRFFHKRRGQVAKVVVQQSPDAPALTVVEPLPERAQLRPAPTEIVPPPWEQHPRDSPSEEALIERPPAVTAPAPIAMHRPGSDTMQGADPCQPSPSRRSWLALLSWIAVGLAVSLATGLAAQRWFFSSSTADSPESHDADGHE